MDNIVVATFTDSRYVYTRNLWQYDYGQYLKIEGLQLPETVEVHFSNSPYRKAKTQLATNGLVAIPDEYLTHHGFVFAWIFLHATPYDGETEYQIRIPVEIRARPTDDPPTPEQQSAITEAIAALNDGVERAESAADRAEAVSDKYPAGGTTGQVLAKKSSEDFDTEWVAPEAGTLPAGGTSGQVLTKKSSVQGDAEWKDLPTFDGAYEVTPLPFGETTLETRQQYLDRNIVVREIPYQQVSNPSGGTTITIGG